MLFSELYKIMVNKVTFVGFMGGDRPNHPLDPPLNTSLNSTGVARGALGAAGPGGTLRGAALC